MNARRTGRATLALLCCMGVASGCSEIAMIRSGPSGANVTVNGTAVGTTPVAYSVSRGDLDKLYQVTIEKSGYEPAAATLQTRIARGRVVGAIFTIGILWVFRSMYYIEPVFAQLQPLASSEEEKDRVIGESLRNLRNLHQRGQISDEEYQRRRRQMLESQ
jgi:uncharacterized membrane protein